MFRIISAIFLSFCVLFSQNLTNDKSVIHGKLDNGFSYYIKVNQTPKNAAMLYLNVGAGSINERDNELGIAHLNEHMVFNSTQDFDQKSLINELEKLGVKFGPDLNAATSFHYTLYQLEINATKQNLQNAIKVLENMAFKALILEDELEKEKGIVIEEDRMRNTGAYRIVTQEMPYIFPGSIFENRFPIGDMDIIRKVDPKFLKSFYQRNYQPQVMDLVAVGDFDPKFVENLIISAFGDKKNKFPISEVDKTIKFFNEFVYFNAYDSQIGDEIVNIYFEDKGEVLQTKSAYKDRMKKDYISKLFAILSSRLQDQKQIYSDIYFYPMDMFSQKSLNTFSQKVLAGDFINSANNIFSLINFVLKNGFSKEDFESAKADFIAYNEREFKQSKTKNSAKIVDEILTYIQRDELFLSPDDEYKLKKEILNEITLDDVNAKFEQIVKAKGVIVEFISKEKLNLTKNDVIKSKNAAPFVFKAKNLDKNIELPAIKSVKFTSKKNIADEVVEYTFPNSIKVLYHFNNMKENEMKYTFMGKGGYSNLESKKFAELAVDISNKSGVGKYSDFDIELLTNGQIFSLNKFISQAFHGYSGASSLKDFENMLKILYLDIDKPKIDPEFFKHHKIYLIDEIKKDMQNPKKIHSKIFNEKYYKNNEKMSNLTIKDVENFDTKKAQKLINKFSNPYEFYLIVSGDMEISEFESLICKYIGSIKTKKVDRKIVDDGIRGSDEDEIIENFISEDKRSLVTIFFTNNDVKYSLENLVKYNAATAILNVVLRENIREKDSKVYSIFAHSNVVKVPYSRFMGILVYSSSPQNAKPIVDEVRKILLDLASKNVDQVYLDNYKKSTILSLKKDSEKNDFWIKKMENYVKNGDKILNNEQMEKLINTLTIDHIKSAFNEIFSPNKMFVGILSPKQ